MLGMQDNKVAIVPLFDPDKSKGGIWIPEQAKDRCDQGVVKYAGPNCKWLKEGDFVVFSGYTGQTLFIEGEGLLIVTTEDACSAVIEGEDIENTEVPGLYFKGKDGYFQCTYEFAITMIRDAFQDAEWRRQTKSQKMLAHRKG